MLLAAMATTQLTAIGLEGQAYAATANATAAQSATELMITEIVPASSGQGQPYEYVEIYNTTGGDISLNNYKLQYYTSSMEQPANEWGIANVTVPAGDAMVLWLIKKDYADVTLPDFNSHYSVNLAPDEVFQVMLTTSKQGLHDSSMRKVAIAGPDGTVVSAAFINDGEADGIADRSVIYTASESAEVTRLRNNELPTPGALIEGQLPADPTDPPIDPPVDPPVEPAEPPMLLITELIPNTANYAGLDAFEYVELYNAESTPVNLQGFTVSSGSWSVKIEQPLLMAPWETMVFWTRRAEVAPLGKDAFNSYYFTSHKSEYLEDSELQIFGNIGGLVNSGTQTVRVTDASGEDVAVAEYSAELVADGKTIVYQYPEEGSVEMRLMNGLQPATPGSLVPGQAPARDVLNPMPPATPEDAVAFAGDGTASISWKGNAEGDIDHYNIYKNGQLATTVAASTYSYTAYALTGGVDYGFQVSAVNTSDKESELTAPLIVTPGHEKLTVSERALWTEPEQYASTWAISEPGPVIPGLEEWVVPQGIAYDEGRDWLLTVSYLDDGRPGSLAVLNASTEQLVKSLSLYEEDSSPYLGHAGGIAVTGESLWMASETYLYRMLMSDVEAAMHGGKVKFQERIPLPVQAAFVTYKDGVLWAGEFYEAKAYPTDPSHHLTNRDNETQYAWMAGYRVDETTGELSADSRNGDSEAAATPQYLMSITGKVQGAAIGESTIYLSTSYGRGNDSVLYRYDNPLQEEPHATVEVNGQSVPLWFLDGQSAKADNAILVTVPMAEGIALAGDELYLLLESGANKYRYTTSFIVDRLLKLDTLAWDGREPEQPGKDVPNVRISQFMYNAPGSDDGKEYIVIRNYGDTAIDIGGYRLGDGIQQDGGEGMAEFPAGTVIGPGQELIVSQSAAAFKEAYGESAQFEFPWYGGFSLEDDASVPDMLNSDWSTGMVQLANGGDELLLMNAEGDVVDFVPYLKDVTYRGVYYKGVTVAADGDGNSIQRIAHTGDASADFQAGQPVFQGDYEQPEPEQPEPEQPETPSTGGGTGGSDGEKDSERYEPTLQQLKDSDGKLELQEDKTVLMLSADTAAWLSLKQLKLLGNGWEATLPADLLHDAVSELTEEQRKKGRFELAYRTIPAEEAAQGLHTHSSIHVSAAGEAIELGLALVDGEGERTKLDALSDAALVELRLSLQSDIDPWLAGVYRIQEDGSYTYLQGKLSDGGITVRVAELGRYAVLAYDKAYRDVPQSHWAHETIRRLSAKHIVTGKSEHAFKPQDAITRAEFAALLTRMLGLQAEGQAPFRDVAADDWHADAIAAAYEAGLIQGLTPDQFKPEEILTREQMAVLLVRAYEHLAGKASGDGASTMFTDSDEISGWAEAELNKAVALQLINGRSENKLAPQGISTRAESAQALYNLVVKLNI